MTRFLLGLFTFLISFSLSSTAQALDPAPGDVCTTANSYIVSGGIENAGIVYTMTCQGGVWVRITESDTSGNLGIGQTAPKAALHIGGETIIGNSGLACSATTEGAIRYDTTGNTIEFCNGSSWVSVLSGVPATDTTPDAFTFTDLTNQSLGTSIGSNVLNITGFDGSLQASVSGGGTPEISINGGAWVTSGAITPGQSLQVRLNSSVSVSTLLTAAVSVGNTSDNWDVTTKAGQTRIFATANTYNGNLGGLAGADTICQNEATTLGYSGTWKALMSDGTTNAKDRLTIAYPVVRASSTSTVVDAVNIWDGSITNSVNTSTNKVWTGTDSSGNKYGGNCSSWSTALSSSNGCYGYGNLSTSKWVVDVLWGGCNDGSGGYLCNNVKKIYCVDQ